MKRLNIPKEFIPKLKELQEEFSDSDSGYYDFQKENNAVLMLATMGLDLYLTFDGRVLVEVYFEDDEPREAKNFAEVAMAIILGAEKRNFPELLILLPERPESAVNCESCENKSGWNNLPGIGRFICENCGGLGWIPKENAKFF